MELFLHQIVTCPTGRRAIVINTESNGRVLLEYETPTPGVYRHHDQVSLPAKLLREVDDAAQEG